MKIKIGPVTYEIIKTTPSAVYSEADFDDGAIGVCDSKKTTITMLKNIPPDLSLLVLTHEIVHAIANTYGIDGLYASEQAVHSLGIAIVNLLKDNPWFTRKFLLKGK